MRLPLECLALTALALAPIACGGSSPEEGAGGASSSATTTATTTSATASSATSTSNTTTSASGGGAASGGTGGGGGSPTADQACADSAHASCLERDKCTNGIGNKLLYGDEATCEARIKAVCLTSLAAMNTGQTPDTLEGCVADYPNYSCADFLDHNPPYPCIPPEGQEATNVACGAPAQCGTTFCARSQYEVCGTCQPLPMIGAQCGDDADCGYDLACVVPAGKAMGACAAYVAEADKCDATHPCAADLSCVGAAGNTMGTCDKAGAAVGVACDSTRKTAPSCDRELGLACIPASKASGVGKCQTIKLAGAGSMCGDLGGTPITSVAACEGGGLCKKVVATDPAGVCVAPAKDGATCDSDPSKGPPCLAPAKCVPAKAGETAGVCTLPDATKCQ